MIVLSILLVSPYLHAQDLLEKYTAAVWKSMAGESLNYRHRAPLQVEDGEKYPLLLFLHGAGGRGDDNRGELTDAGTIQALEKATMNIF